MKRPASVLAAVVVCLAVVGCVGGTDPASNVTNLSAKLNAHGFTNNGPATWWWEYDTVKSELGTANDTEVCGNPPEADRRCGPAGGGSPGSQVPLSVTVTGLTPNTTYYFRACGQDQNAAQAVCANTLSFKTLAGTAYAFDRKWGTKGTANGQFSGPSDIATDPAGNVYVADTGNHRIQKFTGQGGFITKWGTQGTGDGQFQFAYLARLATDSAANVYVLDANTPSRIQKFNSSGTFITKWDVHGFSDITTDPSDNVYVSVGSKMLKFGPTGSALTSWDLQIGATFGTTIAADASSNVYVTATFASFLDKYSSTGSFIARWGSPGSPGTGDGQFQALRGLATDSAGAVYTFDGRIQKFTSTGAFITKFGSEGYGDGQFDNVSAIAVDRFGGVYVAEATDTNNNHRIQKFKPVQ